MGAPVRAASVGGRRHAWQRAKGWPGWFLLAFSVIALLVVGAVRDAGPRSNDERADDIARRLACPICDGESVFESRNDAAVRIRTQIGADVAAGLLSDDQIMASIEQTYGTRVRLVPKATGIDALVWALPTAAFVCAIAGLIVAFRRWRLAADAVPTADDRSLVARALRQERQEREEREEPGGGPGAPSAEAGA